MNEHAPSEPEKPVISNELERHQFLYLTTIGRKTGATHRIEIWFAVQEGLIYLISGGGTRSDWVKNLLVEPTVDFEIGIHRWRATTTIDEAADHPARGLLAARYQNWTPDHPLTNWATDGLVVELKPDGF